MNFNICLKCDKLWYRRAIDKDEAEAYCQAKWPHEDTGLAVVADIPMSPHDWEHHFFFNRDREFSVKWIRQYIKRVPIKLNEHFKLPEKCVYRLEQIID